MSDAATSRRASDLAAAEALKTLWESELAGLAAPGAEDAAAVARTIEAAVLAREGADPLMTTHAEGDAANPYARNAKGGGPCAVM